MLKAGIIGVGGISKAHLPGFSKEEKGEKRFILEAACDIREGQLEELENIRKYTNVDEFLKNEADKLDFVLICVPTYLHKEITIKALESGLHVLCEKPMAINEKECEEMINASNKTGKKLMIAQCNRFYGAVRILKSYIDNGEMGKAYGAEFYREGGDTEPMGYNNWFRDEALSGGAIQDLHVHDTDMVNFLFGMPKAVSTIGVNRIPGAGFDALSTNYVYDDKIVSARCDWTIAHDKFNTRSIRINFEKGYIFIDRTTDRNAFVKVLTDGTTEDLWDKLGFDMYYNETVYFAECIEKNLPCSDCLPESTADSIRIVMAEKESAKKQGEKVYL